MGEAARSLGETALTGIVRRMVSLPRSILGGFSRVVNQGIDLIGIGDRHNQYPQHIHHPNYLPHYPPKQPQMVQEEWAFLATFEQQYGASHPFFYACRFANALKMAQEEHKFLFMYIHSPDHPFTPSFCRETLCSEVTVQFLDANFVSWGALASGGEGMHMAAALRAASFPFCAVVAPASGDNLAVLQQIEGPVSPGEMVEILQRTLEEQGIEFGSARTKQQEKANSNRRLREEQDAAYLASLQIDREKSRMNNPASSENRVTKQESSKQSSGKSKPLTTLKPAITMAEASNKQNTSKTKNSEVTQILIRFPNGERREHSFLCTDKIKAIYRYIDSLGLEGVANYRLISNFPRKVYGADQKGMTLKDSGLHPKASLFLEIL
ncbi:FAS-associated factor 2 [Dorcoceras hygrometricum]|uniref:FAS-associated factor 2 n=1 Tax=Dorcoceras hygrometricum TaxID=472368 RepID=A0A2Z7CFJ7_9LAMI|nr:FAS-associated factor 2 [Dorcoceras hygrometricum]